MAWNLVIFSYGCCSRVGQKADFFPSKMKWLKNVLVGHFLHKNALLATVGVKGVGIYQLIKQHRERSIERNQGTTIGVL